jgi:hypothetical protein
LLFSVIASAAKDLAFVRHRERSEAISHCSRHPENNAELAISLQAGCRARCRSLATTNQVVILSAG